MAEKKIIQLTINLEPTLYELISEAAGAYSMSAYIRKLIMADLLQSGKLTPNKMQQLLLA